MSDSRGDEDEYSSHDTDQSPEARRIAGRTLEELLACAEAYDRATSPSPDAEEWFRGESESLLQWATDTGRLLCPAKLHELIDGFKFLEGGLEVQVYYRKRSGRVFKITKPPHFGMHWYLKGYVQNLIWCNEVFDDDVRLEGVTATADGVSLVLSQPFIIGRKPTEEELEEWFRKQGCERLGPLRWKYPDGLTVLMPIVAI
jgi:hypothetical protein